MSYDSYYPPASSTHQAGMLLDEIDKAFKQVNMICQEYFAIKKKPLLIKENTRPINFNNYKAGSIDSKP